MLADETTPHVDDRPAAPRDRQSYEAQARRLRAETLRAILERIGRGFRGL